MEYERCQTIKRRHHHGAVPWRARSRDVLGFGGVDVWAAAVPSRSAAPVSVAAASVPTRHWDGKDVTASPAAAWLIWVPSYRVRVGPRASDVRHGREAPTVRAAAPGRKPDRKGE